MHLKRQLSEQGSSQTLSCWRYSKIWNLQQQWLEEVEAVSPLQDVAFTTVAIVSEEVVVAQEQDLPKLALTKELERNIWSWRMIFCRFDADNADQDHPIYQKSVWWRYHGRARDKGQVCCPFTCLPLVGRKSVTTLWTNDVWATVKWFRSTEVQEDAYSCANQYPVNDTDRIKKLEESLEMSTTKLYKLSMTWTLTSNSHLQKKNEENGGKARRFMVTEQTNTYSTKRRLVG